MIQPPCALSLLLNIIDPNELIFKYSGYLGIFHKRFYIIRDKFTLKIFVYVDLWKDSTIQTTIGTIWKMYRNLNNEQRSGREEQSNWTEGLKNAFEMETEKLNLSNQPGRKILYIQG